jgi:hypothetical protein
VVYLDHRPLAPSDPVAVLTFRAMPTGPAGVPVRPSPRGTPPGWLPAIEPTAATIPLTAYEQALRKILTTDAYRRYGRHLVHGLAHCNPDLVIATADAIHAAWNRRT